VVSTEPDRARTPALRARALLLGAALASVSSLVATGAPGGSASAASVPARTSPTTLRALHRSRLSDMHVFDLSDLPSAPAQDSTAPVTRAHPHISHQSNATANHAVSSSPLRATHSGPLILSPTLEQLTTFNGETYSNSGCGVGCEPPDTQMAVGPNYVAEAVNETLTVWTRAGSLVKRTSFQSFFFIPGGFYFSDPRILYDQLSGRWFVSGLSLDAYGDSYTYIALSATSDPTGSWAAYVANGYAGVLTDQPGLGLSNDKVVLTWTDFDPAGDLLGGEIEVIDKADLLAAAASVPVDYPFDDSEGGPDPYRFSLQPVADSSASNTAYVVYNDSCSTYSSCTHGLGSPRLGIITLTGVPAGPNTVAWNESDPSITATTEPPNAAEPGGQQIVTDDDRILTTFWRSGTLWATAGDACTPSGDSTQRSCMRLIEVNTGTDAIVSDTDIGTDGVDLYYPAVAVDAAGNTFVAATGSSSTMDPSAVVYSAPTSTSTFTGTTYMAGGGTFDCSACGSEGNRWGDYSGAALDPLNSNDVWAGAEYIASGTNTPDWSTGIGEFSYAAPSVTGVSPNRGLTAGGATVTVTGFDFTSASTVAFGATPAGGVTVDSPTQLTATAPAAGSVGFVDVTVTNGDGTSPTSYLDGYTYETALPYEPMAPQRECDTRAAGSGVAANQCNGYGTGAGTLGQGGTRTIALPSAPAGSDAAVLNFTVTNPTAGSYLTVWPAGTPRPTASNLNFVAHQTVANLVEVALGSALGSENEVSFYNATGSVDVVVDLEGFVTPQSAGTGLFNTLSPTRICDTRGAGPGITLNQCDLTGAGTLGPGASRSIQVTGIGGVPASGVAAVVLNVTVADTTASSFLTVWPTGSAKPTASNLNWLPGKVVPNRVIVPVGTGGKISLYNLTGRTDVIVDVGGWFTDSSNPSATGAQYVALSPSRVCDTRLAPFVTANQCNGEGTFAGTLGTGGSRVVQVAGVAGVAGGAPALVANVTVADTTGSSFLTVWPDGTTRPNASDLNWPAGDVVPNLVVVKIAGDGDVDAYNLNGLADVVVDVEGYYV
jgi:IPT/TIG domain